MGRIKTIEEYQEEIKQMHEKLYSPGAKNDVERTTMERELHNRIKAWSLKVDVIVESPGNEQNPWTMEELGRPVRPMGLMKDTGERQFGDYKVLVCVDKKLKKWVYLPVVVERKGGPQSKKAVRAFSWTAVALDDYSSFIQFLKEEHGIDGIDVEHINVVNSGTTIIVAKDELYIKMQLNDKRNRVEMDLNNTIHKYTVRKSKKDNRLNVYRTVYGPGKGGANDLYGSMYGSTTLKSGKKRCNKDRLEDEICRFREDTRFKQFWIIVESTRTQFMSYRPKFKGKERSSGFGANANSRKAISISTGLHFGGPVCWSGTRPGAIDDFKEIINQGLVFFYAELLELE